MTDQIVAYLTDKLEQYLDDLRVLVSMDSGSQHKTGVDAVNDWLVDRLTRLDFAIERHPQTGVGDNLLARRRGSGQGRIMLLGHSDTVYPLGTAAQRPMTLEGNKILGPGACDMKAGLLSGLYALEALQAIGFDGFETLSYLCVSDEETDPRYSPPLIRAASRQVEVVLTLEAARANGDIVTARKAVHWYTVEAFGRSAHAGVEPEQGRNALLALAHHAVALDQLNGLRAGVTVNTGYIQGGGHFPSVVPDYAKMRLDLRAFTMADMETLLQAVTEQLRRPVVPEVEIKLTFEESSAFPAMERTPQVMILEDLARQAARELGFEVNGAGTGGASDASLAAREGAAVLDGLGPIGGLDHGPGEYIELSSIVPRTALLARLMMLIGQHYPALKSRR